MVNFGLNSASILGIFLAIAGASLYFMRSFRPELSRDQDIFFAAVGLLCGFILLFQGWRLDPILQFGQFLLTGMAVAFGVETIRLRGATTEQAKRSAPTVDRDRRTSRVYRAEIDDMEPYFEEEEPTDTRRRLRGTTSERPPRNERYEDRYEDEDPPSRSTKSRSARTRRKSSSTRPSSRNRPEQPPAVNSRRTTTRSTARSPVPESDLDFEGGDDYYYDDQYPERDSDFLEGDREDYPSSRPPRSRRSSERDVSSRSSRKPRPRSQEEESRSRRTVSRPPINRSSSRRRPSPPPEDYVDYKPIDAPEEDDSNNGDQFDY